jgi:predicted  nucleic acid-binding Zn-ribbon protein
VKAAQGRLDAEKVEVDKEKAVVQKRGADYQTTLKNFQEKRKEVAAKINEKTLSEYTRLSRKPPAIAMVRNGTCQACRFMLRPQALNEVRFNNAIRYCESCKRLIYWAPPEVPVEAETA